MRAGEQILVSYGAIDNSWLLQVILVSYYCTCVLRHTHTHTHTHILVRYDAIDNSWLLQVIYVSSYTLHLYVVSHIRTISGYSSAMAPLTTAGCYRFS